MYWPIFFTDVTDNFLKLVHPVCTYCTLLIVGESCLEVLWGAPAAQLAVLAPHVQGACAGAPCSGRFDSILWLFATCQHSFSCLYFLSCPSAVLSIKAQKAQKYLLKMFWPLKNDSWLNTLHLWMFILLFKFGTNRLFLCSLLLKHEDCHVSVWTCLNQAEPLIWFFHIFIWDYQLWQLG